MDALRFFAALAVVLGHLRDLVWRLPPHDMPLPWWSWVFSQLAAFPRQAVTVFFVLSGFWISRSAHRQIRQPIFWTPFLIDRVSRFWVVVGPVLLLGALLDVIGARLFQGSVYWGGLGNFGLSDGALQNLTPAILIGNLLFLQSLAVAPAGTNGPLWSLAYEFWYYIWFAALALSVARRRPSPALLLLGLGAVWPGLIRLFPVWLMGSAVYHADLRYGKRPGVGTVRSRWHLATSVVVLAAVLILLRPVGTPARAIAADLSVGIAFSWLLWALLRSALPFPRWMGPFAAFGAGASFSLYVVHYPLFAFVLSVAGYNARRAPDLASMMLIVALAVLALAAAWVFSRLTEANTGRLRQSLTRLAGIAQRRPA